MNMFAKAKTVAAKKPASKGKKTKEMIDYGSEFDTCAAASLLSKNLKSLVDSSLSTIKGKVTDFFVSKVMKGEVPESYNAKGENFEGRCNLSKATQRSIDEDTLEVMKKYGVDFETQKDVEERYVFNPELIQDPAIQEAIHEAFQAHPKLKDLEIVQLQEAVEKNVPSDVTLRDIADKVDNENDARRLVNELYNVSVGYFKTDKTDAVCTLATEVLTEGGIMAALGVKEKKSK